MKSNNPITTKSSPPHNEEDPKPTQMAPPSTDPHQSTYTTIFPAVFPMVFDQNRVDQGVPISLLGRFYNGVPPNLQIVDGIAEDSSTFSPRVFLPHLWGSSIVKSARSKRNRAKKMTPNSSSIFTALCSSSRKPERDIYSVTTPDGKKLKFILKKELKNSDVGALGRIILPKRPSEENLPSLSVKEGIQIKIRDVASTKMWRMRYRFWPNNKSRMYVLENTGDFVKKNELKNGDSVMIYQDENNQLYISCKKAENPPLHDEDRSQDGMSLDSFPEMAMVGHSSDKDKDESTSTQLGINNVREGGTSITQITREMDETSCSDDMVREGYGVRFEGSVLNDMKDYDFSDLERLPGFEDYDFSLYDNYLMEDFMDDTDINDGKGEDNMAVHK